MAFNVSQVQFHTVSDTNKYLIDSNIWIDILAPNNNPSFKSRQYRSLFQKIIKNTKVRIMLPSLVVSEVINRILRDVHMVKYARKNGYPNGTIIPKEFYKDRFRKSEEFRIAYNLLCDEIKVYHTSIDLINDSFGDDIKFKHVMSNPPIGLDFNDNYYYTLCKKNNYILVTDDADFWVDGITIITQSQTLIDKQSLVTTKSSIISIESNDN